MSDELEVIRRQIADFRLLILVNESQLIRKRL